MQRKTTFLTAMTMEAMTDETVSFCLLIAGGWVRVVVAKAVTPPLKPPNKNVFLFISSCHHA